jgi:peroxiredoxin Q/BCP
MQVGEKAPNFTISDLQGQRVSLSHYQGKKNVVLVFMRGLSCPFCRAQLEHLRADFEEFYRRDAEILVVAPDSRERVWKYWQEKDLPFTALPDPSHHVANRYDQEVNWLKLGRMPALMVVDKGGHIHLAHYGGAMWDIPANEEILTLLDAVNAQNA